MIKFLDIKAINDQYQNEINTAIKRVLDSGWYIKGQSVNSFEANFAKYSGTAYCVGVANGLDALILIFSALIIQGKLKEGDEVILPANTYIASILALTENKLKPILVEPNPETFNLSIEGVRKNLTSKTKAVLSVHLYGQLTEDISHFCCDNDLLLIEDAAQAHGAENQEGKILLIKQYRYAVDEIIYEIPAGKLEADEDIAECAGRELREETGYTAEKFNKLFEFYPTPGYSTETIYIYQAENLRFVGTDLEEGEYIEVVPKTKAELRELFQAGKIKDSKTLIAVMYYLGDF